MQQTKNILQQVLAGQRLSPENALMLYQNGDLLEIAQAAAQICQQKFPNNMATFIIDRNINYTNVCESRCRFCAFFREKGHPDAYVLSHEEIYQKIEETLQVGGTQIMLQGGLHPDLDLNYFTKLLKEIKSRYTITIHSFSPPEICHLASVSQVSITTVLEQLSEAGLDSLPGGGAEILVDRVRNIISPHKISTAQWLEVMATAHDLGLASTATMMMGTVETPAERILHLTAIRELQDRTQGFRGFIPWTFRPANTDLGGTHTQALEYLRTLALSRLYLDNFPHIQGSWVTQGPEVGQLSLSFGADDLGSIMLEENVVRAADCSYRLEQTEMVRLIHAAGKIPAQRNTQYEYLQVFTHPIY